MNNPALSTRVSSLFTFSNFLAYESREDLVHEIYEGLSAGQKLISSRFFYDEYGSMLFEEITTLPEYYLTRTEKSILKANGKNILGEFEQLDIIDLGSGDCLKISILLETIPKDRIKMVSYIPVDVSKYIIMESAEILSLKYPALKIHGLRADFLKHLDHLPGNGSRLICFFGSTLGNLHHSQSIKLLLNIKKHMKPGDKFLLGVDMVKDTQLLLDAYNDKQGITALFNKNILNVINDIAGTNFNHFDFEHLALYNENKARIEMHLKAMKDLSISSELFNKGVILKKGETIHTENSYKYTMEDIQKFAVYTGFEIKNIFSDNRGWFSLIIFGSND